MTRLPSVGSDLNAWGQILNEYLSVAHNADGTLKNDLGANVKAYGAAGDGTTDDTAAIQSALDSFRTVVLNPGSNYKLTSALILNSSNTRLIGYGATLTQSVATANGISAASTAITNCSVEGVTLTGSCTAAQSDVWGIRLAANSRVANCIIGSFNAAIELIGSGSRAIGNTITSAVGTGSGQGYGVLVLASDCVVSANTMTSIGRHGVYCSGNATFGGASRASVTGNTIYLNGAGADGIKAYASPTAFAGQTTLTGGTIVGNTVVHTSPQAGLANGIGLYEAVSDWAVTGNTVVGFNSAGLKAASTPDGAGPTRVAFVGNSCDGTGFFVRLEQSGANRPADCSAIGNISNINSVTGLSNGGTGTTFIGNTGPGLAYADVKPIGVFTANVTTPSVYKGNVFQTANSGATTITNFADGKPGQLITVIVDANTTVQNNATLKLAGAVNFVGTADDLISLVYDGTAWREMARSVN